MPGEPTPIPDLFGLPETISGPLSETSKRLLGTDGGSLVDWLLSFKNTGEDLGKQLWLMTTEAVGWVDKSVELILGRKVDERVVAGVLGLLGIAAIVLAQKSYKIYLQEQRGRGEDGHKTYTQNGSK